MNGRPLRFTPRRDAGLYGFERALAHAGFNLVAGVDEAGRGACAGPLVIGAAILRDGKRGRIEGLSDSKLLTPARREALYDEIVERAESWSAIIVPRDEVDRYGVHRCNITGMRRAVAALSRRPTYVLSDGFNVPGLVVPSLGVIKGDQVVACIAAASIVAKVTRDRIMIDLHERFPQYGFDEHKGYATKAHTAALAEHGPCSEHRHSFVNVGRVVRKNGNVVVGEPAGEDHETRIEGTRV
ncbi:ribonuclease HII [Actinomadura rupiterrae]|uniref:ribonuclease HII n=1 Tax=Actinomadura rupiterrae TaxID=559627 RepID=UPI0020A332D5|nr:ribonuclease HII [Actinomadura rupiterrae]MCP2339715.1 ribonuclease HII [Actinomadura rupiterrae]